MVFTTRVVQFYLQCCDFFVCRLFIAKACVLLIVTPAHSCLQKWGLINDIYMYHCLMKKGLLMITNYRMSPKKDLCLFKAMDML